MPIDTNQITIGTSPTMIVPPTSRSEITIAFMSGNRVFLGNSGVSTANGQVLPAIEGASETYNTSAAIYGICATGSAVVSYTEIT